MIQNHLNVRLDIVGYKIHYSKVLSFIVTFLGRQKPAASRLALSSV